MVATWGSSGYSLSKSFTRSVKASTLVSESVVFRVVSSMLPKRNFFTSSVSFCGTFSAIILRTASRTALSSRSVLYFARASSYLLGSCFFASWSWRITSLMIPIVVNMFWFVVVFISKPF